MKHVHAKKKINQLVVKGATLIDLRKFPGKYTSIQVTREILKYREQHKFSGVQKLVL